MLLGGWELAILAGAVLLLVVGLWLLRKVTGSILGPLFLYEMVTLARRGTQFRLRVLIAVLLLVGLFLAYLKEFSALELTQFFSGQSVQMPMNRQAQFAETFLVAFMSVQLLMVMLIIPALAGSAIAEEKERGSLDYLRSTLLTPWEIGMGKFFARMVFLLAIVATGLPVLALAMNQGGMDERYIFAGYTITFGTAVSLGGWSFYMGTVMSSLRQVLLWVYGVVGGLTVFGLCFGCCPGVAVISPVSVMTYTFVGKWTSDPNEYGFWLNTLLFGVLHTIIGVLFSLRAIFLIRIAPPTRHNPQDRKRRRRRDTYYDDDEDDDEPLPPPPPPAHEEKPKRVIARRSFRVPMVPAEGSPFTWKERFFGGKSSAFESEMLTGCSIIFLAGGLFAVGLYLFFAMAIELDRGQWSGEAVSGPLRFLMTVSVLAIGLILGVRLSGSVSFERQKQTLDALLTIPVDRWTILWGKLYAAFFLLRFVFMGLFLALIAGTLTMGLHPFGFVLGLLVSAGYIAFMALFGLWMSTRCKTSTRATVYVLLMTMLLWFGPLLLSPVFDIVFSLITGQGVDYSASFAGFSAPVALWQSFFGWADFKNLITEKDQVRVIHKAMAFFLGVGLLGGATLSWLAAQWRFDREGK